MSEKKNVVTVEINPEMHPGQEPEDAEQALAWAALDTIWGIMSEYAARTVLASIRTQVKEQGGDFPDDAEILEILKSEGFEKFADLAMGDHLAAGLLQGAFDHIVHSTFLAAAKEMDFDVQGEVEAP